MTFKNEEDYGWVCLRCGECHTSPEGNGGDCTQPGEEHYIIPEGEITQEVIHNFNEVEKVLRRRRAFMPGYDAALKEWLS